MNKNKKVGKGTKEVSTFIGNYENCVYYFKERKSLEKQIRTNTMLIVCTKLKKLGESGELKRRKNGIKI